MANLNIRDFPDDVMKELKREAVDCSQTLRELVIAKLSIIKLEARNGNAGDARKETVDLHGGSLERRADTPVRGCGKEPRGAAETPAGAYAYAATVESGVPDDEEPAEREGEVEPNWIQVPREREGILMCREHRDRYCPSCEQD